METTETRGEAARERLFFQCFFLTKFDGAKETKKMINKK